MVGEPLALVTLWVLEVQVVFLNVLLVELAGSHIHGDVDLSFVTGIVDGIGYQGQSLIGSVNVWCNTTLVSDVACGLAVPLLCKGLQGVVDLSAPAEGFRERWSSTINLLLSTYIGIHAWLNHRLILTMGRS